MPFVPDAKPPAAGRFVPDAAPEFGDPRSDPAVARGEQEAIGVREDARLKRENLVRENALPGVPLDLDSGLPAATRSRLSFEKDIDRQADILTKAGHQVRKTKDGTNLIVRDGDKEVLLHPLNPTVNAGDVAGATFPILKGAVGAGTALATGGAPLLMQAGAMGLNLAGTQAVGEGGSRLLAGQTAGDLTSDALAEGAENAAIPALGAAAKGTSNAIRSRILAGAGELERRVPAAAARLGVEATPAMTSGSPAVAKLGKLTTAEETARQGALKATQDRAIGPSGRSTVLAEDEIANKAKPIFSDAEQAAKSDVTAKMTDAEREAQKQIQASLDSGLVPTTLTNSQAGAHLRGKFEAFEQGVKDAAAKNYPAFHEKAAEEGIVLNKKPITDLVSKISQEDPTGAQELLAPSIKQVKNVESKLTKPLAEAEPTGLVDARGRPIMKDEVPSPDLTFQDAIKLRSIVRTKLNSPTDPLGDVVKSYYSRLEKALTESIDDGLKRGSPELRTLYDTARGSYAKGADALDRGVVQKLFRNVGEAGRVPDEEVVRQVFSGKGKLTALQDMKNILDPKDYQLLLRSGVNNIMEDAAGGSATIDAGKFLSRINAIDPEVRREVLGSVSPGLEKELRDTATIMQRAQGTKIPKAELEDALRSKSGAGVMLERAIAREQQAQQEFNGTVQQALRNGVLTPKTASNDRFVSFLTSDVVDAADTRQALTQIAAKSPEAAEQIRQRVLKNVLDETGVKPPLGRETTGEVFDVDHSKLAAMLREATPSREKLQAAVGKEGVQFLDDLATYAEANAKRQVNEAGRHVSPETLAKETGSAALGFRRNAVGALVDVAALVGRALGGGRLVRSQAFKDWLETGALPVLSGPVGKPLRGVAVAAPSVLGAKSAMEEGKN